MTIVDVEPVRRNFIKQTILFLFFLSTDIEFHLFVFEATCDRKQLQRSAITRQLVFAKCDDDDNIIRHKLFVNANDDNAFNNFVCNRDNNSNINKIDDVNDTCCFVNKIDRNANSDNHNNYINHTDKFCKFDSESNYHDEFVDNGNCVVVATARAKANERYFARRRRCRQHKYRKASSTGATALRSQCASRATLVGFDVDVNISASD